MLGGQHTSAVTRGAATQNIRSDYNEVSAKRVLLVNCFVVLAEKKQLVQNVCHIATTAAGLVRCLHRK